MNDKAFLINKKTMRGVEMNELPKEADTFDVIKKALIIITPEGEIFTVEDKGQRMHKDLFNAVNNDKVQELIKNALPFGNTMSLKLSQNGYTILFGNNASSVSGAKYYYKVLDLPSKWEQGEEAKNKYLSLLRTFEHMSPEIIDKGLALEINIITPNGRFVTIHYPNDEFKNKKFKAEEVAKLIESKQGELENENNNQRPGGWYI